MNHIKSGPTNKRGFTLIELLVVIAIIAILAAILFPVFAQAKAAAKKTVCLSDTKQIALANIMYENDYDDFIVPGMVPADPGSVELSYEYNAGQPSYDNAFDHLLMPYIKTVGLWVCPQSPTASVSSTDPAYKSITMNADVAVDLTGFAFFPNSVVSASSVEAPSSLILEGDGEPTPYNNPADSFIGTEDSAFGACSAWEDEAANQAPASYDEYYRRHNETANYSLSDGHSKALHPSQTLFPNVMWFKENPKATDMAAAPQGAGWFFPAAVAPVSPTMDCHVFQYWDGDGGF